LHVRLANIAEIDRDVPQERAGTWDSMRLIYILLVMLSSSRSSMVRRIPEVGVSFSPAGLLTPFHIGVSNELQRLGVVGPDTVLAGASGGSLAATTTALGISSESALDACCYIASRCRDEGTRLTLRLALDVILDRVLPAEAATMLNTRIASCFVAYTEILPKVQPHFVNEFTSKVSKPHGLRSQRILRFVVFIPTPFNSNSNSISSLPRVSCSSCV
jgi:hypothetical protein